VNEAQAGIQGRQTPGRAGGCEADANSTPESREAEQIRGKEDKKLFTGGQSLLNLPTLPGLAARIAGIH